MRATEVAVAEHSMLASVADAAIVPLGSGAEPMAATAARNNAEVSRYGDGAREAGGAGHRRGMQASLEGRMNADVQPACVAEASAKRMSRWWPKGCGLSQSSAEISAMSFVSQSVRGDGLEFLRFALKASGTTSLQRRCPVALWDA